MSQRTSISRTLAERLTRIPGSAGGIVMGAIVLTALPVVCLMEVSSATATFAVAFSFGGALPIAASAVQRGLHKPRHCLAEHRRIGVQPLRHR